MIEQSVRDFFERYATLYMAFDATATAELCNVPFLAVREGRPIHLTDDVALHDHLAWLMDAYREAGATEASIGDLTVIDLDRTVALATVHWTALRADRSILRSFLTSYLILRGPSGWRILGYVYHQE